MKVNTTTLSHIKIAKLKTFKKKKTQFYSNDRIRERESSLFIENKKKFDKIISTRQKANNK